MDRRHRLGRVESAQWLERGGRVFRYQAHGLTIESDLQLPAYRAVSAAADEPDVRVISRVPEWPSESGSPQLVLLDETPGRNLKVWRDINGRHHLEAEGVDMWFDAAAKVIQVRHDPAATPVVGWMVGGIGVAMALLCRGEVVLHGSMIEWDGLGILLMAPSGYGKSLTAAVACSAGASLIAEDSVNLDVVDGGWVARGGSTVLRLRRTLDEVHALFPERELLTSSDGRVLVDLDPPTGSVVLDRVWFAALDLELNVATVTPVDEVEALMACMSHLRTPGLLPGELLEHQFDRVGQLVSSTKASVIRLPWTGSVPELVPRMLSCLGELER